MTTHPELHFQPVAGLLAFVFPGLGHCYLGDVRRGALIATGVLGLLLGGTLIGGIDVIDRTEDKWWFVLQAGAGPAVFVADAVHQNVLKTQERRGTQVFRRSPLPAERPTDPQPASTKSLGRVNEVGSLFTALGGMMNMIVIIDALWFPARTRRERRA